MMLNAAFRFCQFRRSEIGRWEIPLRRNEMVRKGGLEPPRFYPPDPKSGASANSATFANPYDYTKLRGLRCCRSGTYEKNGNRRALRREAARAKLPQNRRQAIS